MWSIIGMDERGLLKYSMSVSMYRGGGRGFGRLRIVFFDLFFLFLDVRIVYFGMLVRYFWSNCLC